MNTTPVAFFDFDGTLTKSDTLLPFLKFVIGRPSFYIKLTKVSPVLIAYIAGVLRNDVAKEIVLQSFLSGYSLQELNEFGKRFSSEVIPKMLRAEGIDRLLWHKSQGHDCVLVSASLDVYLRYWARSFGFSGLLSTSLVFSSDGVTCGNLKGKNCYGDEKLRRVKEWLSDRCPSLIYAYGDTKGDMPLIKFSNNGWIWKKGRFVRIV
ncbi:HAD-IB family hydrolase [Microbulbifer thermotolerans]|uniref:HAD-IB family hydrolase n=1 Tax=Microbulbifer thermotolerans TaxID=252514 RepID=UPI0008DFFD03|nr:HAD-IB family hydrolase [Microbulbifer thermotolerans]MCX2793858.1 HAD-IB family hydrolase [Microbulbifer thermotolerans]MCX2834314.1 HAD-IB family hydrolase [Microbulbifer thermotolerans]WKT61635.1 HAD-IB family hydrolase [Microbulbifer thermotolerans]SFB70768.1 HAD-superfamily subfamily IB hydrolase, TIGR01490 [Microbulbifer thermotolerans]